MLRTTASMRFITMFGFFAVALLGCDLTRFTANSTSHLFERAAPAFESYWDYEVAGNAVQANIMQLEGVLRVVPDNEIIALQLVRAYMGFAYGWVEDSVEVAEAEGDFVEADRQRDRAKRFYLRARDLGQHMIRQEHEGFDEVMDAGFEDFERWLDSEFTEPEHAPALLWVGYAWGSAIAAGSNDMTLVADLPFARAMVERSVELDPTYYNGAGLVMLGVAEVVTLGGDVEAGRAYFERALEITNRRSLIVQVNFARTYAVHAENRELYIQLLREVLEAGDVNPEGRLITVIAKRRAQRSLERIEESFP